MHVEKEGTAERGIQMSMRVGAQGSVKFSMRTEMQENTWARLRESSMYQGASHAT